MTVISCNIKHYCPTRCARDFIIISEHQNVGTLADLLLRYLGVSVSSVCVTCVTEAQYLLLSVDVQRKERSAVGRHLHLVVLVCGMFKAQRGFFLINKSQYAENRSREVLVYCVTLFHLHHPLLPCLKTYTLCRMLWEGGLFSFAERFAAERF